MSTNGFVDPPPSESERPESGMNGTARLKKLCSFCQKLGLSINNFVINNGKFGRPQKAAKQSFSGDRHHGSNSLLKSGSGCIQLGNLCAIRERMETGCRFCYLVVKSAGDANDEVDEISVTCSMNWEIDGRDNVGRRAQTRRLHLHWDGNKLPDSYLVFVAPKRLFEFNSDSQGSWEREAFFLGRELKTNGNNQVLMKSWLDQCLTSHGDACSTDHNEKFLEMATQSYFGVIDVLDMCLKSLPLRPGREEKRSSSNSQPNGRAEPVHIYPSDVRRRSWEAPPESRSSSNTNDQDSEARYEPYVALSYVWGLTDNYTTDISNIRVHQQQGSLETFLDKIPKVIRDAMDLVRRLGLRYLWVDSLCIVQDSKRSWDLNSRQMNLIYGNAFLTICAADGTDAWFGLKALDSSGHSTTQHIAKCGSGVTLMVSQLAETGINSSVWNTRAWTFQERLLSKRCLIFTEGRVFFQCRSATMSEDLVSESHGAGWSLDLAKALPQVLHELKRRPIKVYMDCMSLYSGRLLTQPKDVLAAFNGVSNFISDVMQAPFIFGLPSSHFDLALLWEPLSFGSRRIEQPGEDWQDLKFPSWSWCGWQGGPMGYRDSQLEGVIMNVHEWLTEHTWIAWYIRDGKGNLRPVWDGEKSKACESVEGRWKGYQEGSPDLEFVRLQQDALRNLGKPNEDDFMMWSKEQEEAEREITRATARLAGNVVEVRYHYEDDHYKHHHKREPDRGYEREMRSRSRSRGRNRDQDRGQNPAEEVDEASLRDEYGRRMPLDIVQKIRSGFQQCLPDNPFRVYIEPYTSHPDKDFPDQPLLQFWTWQASLRLVKFELTATSPDTHAPTGGLQKYSIADGVGDWCGSILLDSSWVSSEARKGHRVDGSERAFLAISDARNFTKEECDVWTYYVPKERQNSEWDLYYVLLVEKRDRIWYRVGLGKVFKASFENAVGRKRWREIILG